MKDYTFTATAGTVANVVTGLVGLIEADRTAGELPAEFEELTWEDDTTHITVTSPDGVPFVQTSSATGGTASLTTATTQAATGASFLDDTENWSGGAIPGNGDIVIIADIDTPVLYGLDALNGITLGEFHLRLSYEGSQFGLKPVNDNGYFEYRQRTVTIKATKSFIGEGSGSGCPFVNIDFSSVQTELICYGTGRSQDQVTPALCIVGTHASNVMRFFKGDFGIAYFPGDLATVATLQVGYLGDQNRDVTGIVGRGSTITNLDFSGGETILELFTANAAVLNAIGGSITINGDKGITTTFVATGNAAIFWNTTGTLGGAPVLADDARLDFSQDMRAKTITNPIEVQSSNVVVNDPFQVASNLRLDCNYAKVVLNGNSNLGSNVRITRGTPA